MDCFPDCPRRERENGFTTESLKTFDLEQDSICSKSVANSVTEYMPVVDLDMSGGYCFLRMFYNPKVKRKNLGFQF